MIQGQDKEKTVMGGNGWSWGKGLGGKRLVGKGWGEGGLS